MRWELNDLARRLDHKTPDVALLESLAVARRLVVRNLANSTKDFQAIEELPDDEREVFSLVRIPRDDAC